LLSLAGQTDPVKAIAFSPDGQRLAAASWREVKVWDARTGREVLTVQGRNCLAFSADGKRIATGAADKTVKVWDGASGAELLALRDHTSEVASVAFSPDGRRIATGAGIPDQRVRVWDA